MLIFTHHHNVIDKYFLKKSITEDNILEFFQAYK